MDDSLVGRFLQSMEMNHERWHDGVGYDLDLLRSAGPEEREQLESLLLGGGVRDWRHVEALAVLDSPKARAALRRAFEIGDDELRIALLSHAPGIFDEEEHTSVIVSALGKTGIHDGLTQALLLVEDFHPPEVIDALLRGVLNRDGATAGEFAAMLLYLHGKAAEPYDMEHRPFFLKFQDDDRAGLFRQLCERIGVDVAEQERLMG